MKMQSRTNRICSKLDVVAPYMFQQASKIWEHPDFTAVYLGYLEKMHSVVRSAVSLMDCAIDKARQNYETNHAIELFIEYLLHHREEERGHDVWILEDYHVAGGDPENLKSKIPSVEAAHLVGAQYYWINHAHPFSILGHMMALEGYHPPLGFAQGLSDKSGLPIEAFRAIKRHEKLDIAHKRELFEFIDNLELTDNHEKLITMSGLHTMRCAAELLATVSPISCGSHSQESFEKGMQST
ncbi:iron-containing redox enzyme family protein [Sphingorhabdus sp. Alg239-R122]|uniref:iron-containing redox enzyme family protein n=1 Tax=Sphingorhabdus sp. Alg239-R122 TaxID=2305989 RepID=UPI0013D9E2F2|nr:iron-containing redox enzyme family protein [Sphingorhabdus sp. Alg239-R122]